jgi:prepilin-type N-terminal cleavage/methylation domain-containing protein
MTRQRQTCPTRRPRSGFTLIEMLIVVVIIAILVALLIPAVAGAVRAARAAAVQAEINQMAQALAAFKSKYGDYPPSRVLLFESGAMPTGGPLSTVTVPSGGVTAPNDITVGTLATRTVTAFRKFWPRVQFNTSGGDYWPQAANAPWYDFNGNGAYDNSASLGTPSNKPFILQGNECLAFFVGGIPLPGNYDANGVPHSFSMIGFGTNPVNPFSNGIVNPPNAMYSPNRSAPLFEFDSARLVLTNTALQSSYGTGLIPSLIPGYIDSLGSQSPAQNFYAYFSTNVGSGYDPNDVNFNETDPSGSTSPIALQFPSLAPVVGSAVAGTVVSPSPNPYTTSTLVNPANPAVIPPVSYTSPQSFQLFSAGADGSYGVGGTYTPSAATVPLPSYQNLGITNSTDGGLRILENDNLTNFHNGKLN